MNGKLSLMTLTETNMNRDIRKLIKKVDELQKQLNQQNEYIMDQSIIIQKLIEKLVAIPSYTYPSTPSIDPHFVKDIPYIPGIFL